MSPAQRERAARVDTSARARGLVLVVENVPIAALHEDPANVRRHSPRNLGAIKASLVRFGQRKPIVVGPGNVVVAGNGTLAAARELGWPTVAVVRTTLAGPEATAFAIADNRTAELAEWDEGGLSAMLESLREQDAELAAATGFLDAEMARLAAAAGGHDVTEDEPPEPPANPVTQPGDLWTMGGHRLLCDSCEALRARLPDAAAHIMVTDPPYGVAYADKNRFLNAVGRGNHIQEPIADDHHTPAEMSALWLRWFSAVRPLCKPGAAYYVTGPQGGDLLLLLLALREAGYPLRHMLVWAKNNHVLGRSDYHYQHEPIIYGWVEGAHHAVTNRGETSLWQIDKPHKSDLHPTMKPVALYARAIGNSSDVGDTVLDPFCGSGTAVVAAEQLGRKCVAAEVDPHYCDVVVQRWETLTGGKATRKGAP